MTVDILGVDHVQIAMPEGEEALARLFYAGILGLVEVRRPRALRRRGGAWFVGQGYSIHLSVDQAFRASRQAHFALVVADLQVAIRRLMAAGVEIDPDPSGLPIRRCYIWDPFGNRIELVDLADRGFTEQRPARRPPR
jgi:catechol 2,3-dioxygenase-like lactoylglutathione lyase family enzyme